MPTLDLHYDFSVGAGWMLALALQFGCQPIVTQFYASDFASKDPVLNPRMMVVVTELMKVLISIVAMVAAGESHLFAEVNLLRNPAVIPAVSYSLQNIFIYLAYFSLDPLVANILNPTKVVFTVCFSYVLLGRKTNLREVSALALLFAVIVVVKLDEELHQSDGSLMGRGSKIAFAADGFFYAMTASLLSGFGSATCELIMTPWKKSEEEAPATKSGSRGRVVSAGEAGVEQDNDAGRAQSPATDKRGKSSSAAPTRRAKSPTPVLSNGTGKGKRGVSPAGGSRMNKDVVTGELHQPSGVEKKKSGYLFSLELSFFTLSLTVLQIAGMSVLYDVQPLSWETHCPPLASMVPLMTQASGGIIVGQVTKYVGGVAKGFVIVAGIVVTAVLNSFLTERTPSIRLVGAVVVIGFSLYLQATAQIRTVAVGRTAVSGAKKRQ